MRRATSRTLITRLNRIRRENRALQQLRNLRFHHADNDLVLYYVKSTPARDNLLLIVVNLDAWHTQDAFIDVPLEDFGFSANEPYQVHDLLTDERYLWTGRRNFVRLDPHNARARLPHPPEGGERSELRNVFVGSGGHHAKTQRRKGESHVSAFPVTVAAG